MKVLTLISKSLLVVFPGFVTSLFAGMVTNFDYQGAKLILKSADCEEYEKPDGLLISKCGKQEKAKFRDGTIINRFPDGRRDIVYPDGTSLSIQPDGNRTYTYTDGKERVFSMDGRTPFGEEIQSFEKILAGGDCVIAIIYSGVRSDEQMRPAAYNDPDAAKLPVHAGIAKLFDELTDAVARSIKAQKPGSVIKADIILSQCRYCSSGYCYRKKAKGVFLEIAGVSSTIWQGMVPFSEIEDNQKRQELVYQAIGRIFPQE